MKIICGLGNPGPEYSQTRHNVGFILIDGISYFLSDKINQKIEFSNKWNALVATVDYKGYKILLVKPQTFMNLSGKSLTQIKSFYKVENKDIYVIHDDIDLELGRIKVKLGGGSGGHNGIKSIDASIGNDYIRIRLGVGKQANVSSYVLGKFQDNELHEIEQAFHKITENFDLLLEGDLNKFSSKL